MLSGLPFLLRQGYGGQVGPKPALRRLLERLFGVQPRYCAKEQICSSAQQKLGRARRGRFRKLPASNFGSWAESSGGIPNG
jgi:hypothetical protein